MYRGRKILFAIGILVMSMYLGGCNSKEDSSTEKTEVEQEELTLGILRELVVSGTLETTDFKQYSNADIDMLDENALNYYVNFPFQVEDDVITLKVSLMKENDDLERNIYLLRESNSETLMLQNCTVEELDIFLVDKYDICDEITFTIPEGLVLEDYNADIGYAGGCLLTPLAYESGEYVPENWKAAGLLGRFRADGLVEWDGEQIKSVASFLNHSAMEPIGSVEDLFLPGYVLKGSHDLYTAAELGELEEQGIELSTIETTSEYWYIFMAEPDSEFGYVISLNAKNYSMEDAVEFAGSVVYK